MRENFCHEYVIDFNGTQAAIRAGYSKKTAYAQANQMLDDLEVQLVIAQVKSGQREKLIFGRDEVLRELQRIAGADVRKLYGANGHLKKITELDDDTASAVDSIEHNIGAETVIAKVKMSSKLGALKELAKHHNIYEDHQKAQAPMVVNFQGKFLNV